MSHKCTVTQCQRIVDFVQSISIAFFRSIFYIKVTGTRNGGSPTQVILTRFVRIDFAIVFPYHLDTYLHKCKLLCVKTTFQFSIGRTRPPFGSTVIISTTFRWSHTKMSIVILVKHPCFSSKIRSTTSQSIIHRGVEQSHIIICNRNCLADSS